MSVELALAAHCGRVYAVECEADACALIRRNRERFGAWNMTPVQGRAPEALAGLPAPDVVFIGGTGGGMAGVVDAALARSRPRGSAFPQLRWRRFPPPLRR